MTHQLPPSLNHDDYEAVPDKPEIGTGAYGTVKISRKIAHPNELVVIKTLRYSDDDSANAEMNRILRKELAPLLVKCEHRNIVKCLGILHYSNGADAIVLSYVKNGSLTKNLPKMLPAERLQVVKDVAEGLNFLHTPRQVAGYNKLEIAHGDLHPGNVLIDTDGTAVLADFGLCKLAESGHQPSLSLRIDGPAGVALYTAPELHSTRKVQGGAGYEYTARRSLTSDMFAFGMLMFVVLGGNPDLGPTSLAVTNALIGRVRPLREHIASGISDGHWSVIEDCWVHNPAARPSIGDVLPRLH